MSELKNTTANPNINSTTNNSNNNTNNSTTTTLKATKSFEEMKKIEKELDKQIKKDKDYGKINDFNRKNQIQNIRLKTQFYNNDFIRCSNACFSSFQLIKNSDNEIILENNPCMEECVGIHLEINKTIAPLINKLENDLKNTIFN